MELSDDGKKTEDINWADYFDELVNEAWLETHQRLQPDLGRKERAANLRLNEGGTDL